MMVPLAEAWTKSIDGRDGRGVSFYGVNLALCCWGGGQVVRAARAAKANCSRDAGNEPMDRPCGADRMGGPHTGRAGLCKASPMTKYSPLGTIISGMERVSR